MNIFINTLGSRGDVQPYVALGVALKARGHTVTVCTSARFESFITEHGLLYGYMNDEILALTDSPEVRDMMGNTKDVFGAIRMVAKMAKQVGPLQRKMVNESGEAALAANPDLVIFHPKAYGGPHYAEKLGVPSIMAPTLPQFIPTAEIVPIGFPKLPLGGWYNRMGYSLTTRLTVMGVAQYTNAWRKDHGLQPLSRFANFLRYQAGQPIEVMHPISKYVMPVPSDWPDYVHSTGYWFLDTRDDWTPPADLVAFLEAGPPPVYVGFGSMVGTDPETITQTIVAGLQKAKVRAVLATGWGGLQADSLPDTIFKLEQAPHEWLFPKMAAVVHHGGAGTTAAGVRAGKPTFVSPYFGDQPFWSQRIYELGIGPEPIHQKKLTADSLAAAVTEVTNNVSMRQKAETLGAQIRQEDGIGNAIAIIEKVLKR
ncbi:MAG: UDP-glucose--sterol glucosyltransferase [Anaerolineaceae bacterium]|nr:UDP-glucose--sterol glucosyltransferase [Anaerolineaceae bacterium]